MKILLIIVISILFSSCISEKKILINGKQIDEEEVLWEFAAKLEEEYHKIDKSPEALQYNYQHESNDYYPPNENGDLGHPTNLEH